MKRKDIPAGHTLHPLPVCPLLTSQRKGRGSRVAVTTCAPSLGFLYIGKDGIEKGKCCEDILHVALLWGDSG